MAEYPKWMKYGTIPGFLFFGTATVVVQKLILETKGYGSPQYGYHAFAKPWFLTVVMFVGMALSLPIYLVLVAVRKFSSKKKAEKAEESQEAEDKAQGDTTKPEIKHNNGAVTVKTTLFQAVFSICDLLSTAILNIALLSITASTWQMLRGSMVLFSSIFQAFILKRPHHPYMWWSVLVVIIALVVVGSSSVISSGVSNPGVSSGTIVLAICLTVASQVIAATKVVGEDWLLHDYDQDPAFVVGISGVWGTIESFAIFFPLTQYAFKSSKEGAGLNEDWYDTFKMFSKSGTLIGLNVLYALMVLGFNITATLLINVSSAVYRTIMEGIRTLCIWVIQVIIFYSMWKKPLGWHHPTIGESLSIYSLMQFGGFLILFTGTLMYNKVLRLPIFKYYDSFGVKESQGLENEEKEDEGKKSEHDDPDSIPVETPSFSTPASSTISESESGSLVTSVSV